MSTEVLMKDMTVQTEFPLTADVATSTIVFWSDQDGSNSPSTDLNAEDRKPIRTRSDLTLTDLPLFCSNTVLKERLRLLQEEAELEEQVQEARLAALRVKKELLLNRIRHHDSQSCGGSFN